MKVLWSKEKIKQLYELSLMDLVYQSQTIHRAHFNPNEMELCTLINIKTGACPENCAYCPQSGHYETGVGKEKLLSVEQVLEKAKLAKANGATRFCMGAAWRNPSEKDFPIVLKMIKAVNELGLESCLTAGMLSRVQAAELKQADLNYYNHNLDTSPTYYENIITTHSYQDRLDTLEHVRSVGINVCCGGILGLGESREDRIDFLLQLVRLPSPPKSVPLNRLIPIPGTPLEKQHKIDDIEFIRTVAVARIMMPLSMIRLTAGRAEMSEEMQAMCFLAGANSIHFGEKLLVTKNPSMDKDLIMLKKLGFRTKMDNKSETAVC